MTHAVIENDLRDLYQDLILDHGKRPRNFHKQPDANREALGSNPLCGDRLIVYLTVTDKGIIQDAAFQGSGCAISMASASMMTEMLKGKTSAEAEKLFKYVHTACTEDAELESSGLTDDDVDRLTALAGVRNYPMRVKCATLAWHTLQAALKNQQKVSTE